MTGRGGAAVPALAIATAVIATVEFVVIGLLPILAADLGVSLSTAGWLVSGFALAAALFGPAATLLSEHWQPRNLLGACLLLFCFGNLAAAAAPSFPLLLGVRLIQGTALTVFIGVASSVAAQLAGRGNAGRALGWVNLGTVVATVAVVPAGVAAAGTVGWRAVFTALGVLAALAAIAVRCSLPTLERHGSGAGTGAVGVLRRPRFLGHLLLSALLFTAMFTSYSYIAALVVRVGGLREQSLAPALLIFGIAGMLGNWLAARRVEQLPTTLTALIAAILAVTVAALPLASGSALATFLLVAVWGAAHTAAFVTCQVRVMLAAPDADAFAASLNISLCNLGIAGGAVLGGQVIAHSQIALLGPATAAVGATALLAALLLCGREPARTEQTQAGSDISHCTSPE